MNTQQCYYENMQRYCIQGKRQHCYHYHEYVWNMEHCSHQDIWHAFVQYIVLVVYDIYLLHVYIRCLCLSFLGNISFCKQCKKCLHYTVTQYNINILLNILASLKSTVAEIADIINSICHC